MKTLTEAHWKCFQWCPFLVLALTRSNPWGISLWTHPPSCNIIKTNLNSQLLRFNCRLLAGEHSSSAPAAQRQTTTWQRDVPRCILRRAWRQLEAFLHLASVISVSGDSHLVQGGEHEGATQTVSENGLCCVTSKARLRRQFEAASDKQLLVAVFGETSLNQDVCEVDTQPYLLHISCTSWYYNNLSLLHVISLSIFFFLAEYIMIYSDKK